jgi:hypothetical protein
MLDAAAKYDLCVDSAARVMLRLEPLAPIYHSHKRFWRVLGKHVSVTPKDALIREGVHE